MKSHAEFPPVRRGEAKLQSWCRACFAQNNARYYRENHDAQKARLLQNSAARQRENQARMIAYLLEHPCVDCGEIDITVLEFDHLRDKTKDISALMKGTSSWSRIEAEIVKCVVRCANCHRRATERRRRRVPSVVVPATKRRAARSAQRIEAPSDAVRQCRVCSQTRTISDFPYRSLAKGTRKWICVSCQQAYSRAWYQRNVDRHRQTARRTAARLRAAASRFVGLFLAAHPCIACGETDVAVLDFDHQRDKVANISKMVRQGVSTAILELEMSKCQVLCANCHRRATALKGQWYRTRTIEEDDLLPGRRSTSRRLAS
jgi:hypothetical protein